ncbi:MAG TPA: hypothetical protein VF719_02150, partial [Abditibacteriaceae bacterium]
QPLLDAGVDTVILGCTHYPLLLPVLREAAPAMRFVDPAEAVAAEVKRRAQTHSAIAGEDRFFASGESEGVARWIEKLLSQNADVETGPVFDLPSDAKHAKPETTKFGCTL